MVPCNAECTRLNRLKQLDEAFGGGSSSSSKDDADHDVDTSVECYDEDLIAMAGSVIGVRNLERIETRFCGAVKRRDTAYLEQTGNSNTRVLCEQYAFLHFGLTTSIGKNEGDRHTHVRASFSQTVSRIPNPRLSAVLQALLDSNSLTNDYHLLETIRASRVPPGVYGCRDEQLKVLMFGDSSPRVFFDNLGADVSTNGLLQYLYEWRARIRLRWLNKRTAFVDCLDEHTANVVHDAFARKVGPHPLKKCRVHIPGLTGSTARSSSQRHSEAASGSSVNSPDPQAPPESTHRERDDAW
eukprot:Filipodium_phascolosomae@DN4714_c0_g1_i1.p1